MDNLVGEFTVAGFTGHNPFPTDEDRLAWIKTQLTAQGVHPGVYVLASDLDSEELVLLLGKSFRYQVRHGANLEALGHVIVMHSEHAATLERLNSAVDSNTVAASV